MADSGRSRRYGENKSLPRPAHGSAPDLTLPASPAPARTALYAAFDRFPSAKGAATHIGHFAHAMFAYAGGGTLVVLGDSDHPAYQREGTIEIVRQTRQHPHFLNRALAFGALADRCARRCGSDLRLVHFRDPWSGYPLLHRAARPYRAVYEVNALPSVELPHSYPALTGAGVREIQAVEDFCLQAADHLVVPAATVADYLRQRGVAAERITVIPNGAEVPDTVPRTAELPDRYLLYFGALQEWQGLATLLRAFALLRDYPDLRLAICASDYSPNERDYRQLANKLGVAERVLWRRRLSQAELAPWRAHALLAVAPLTDCLRNARQGCCPLKIVEAMAAGTPVVASDLPPVRELLSDGITGYLVPPDNPSALARRIRVALACPGQRREIALAARARAREQYTWTAAGAALTAVYDKLKVARDGGAEPAKENSYGGM